MRELTERLKISATHLSLVDQFAAEVLDEYAEMRSRLTAVPGYVRLVEKLYHGQKNRQMILGDILLYMLTGRGFWTAVETRNGFKEFVSMLMYIANLLLIQETLLSARPKERRRFLRRLRAAKLEEFFASKDERHRYSELMSFDKRISVRGETRPLYKAMDSVLPRTPGLVYELLVYVHLLVRRLGYSVPLLILQRLFRGHDSLAPPDYLLLRPDGNIFGIEVGSGMGQFSLTAGKIEQVNRFSQDTSIPVLTVTVPDVYRCAACEGWITFCDTVIERTAEGEASLEKMSALECPRYGETPCEHTIYYGGIEPHGKRLRYHYRCAIGYSYVRSALRTEDHRRQRLLHYFPHVKGLERLAEAPPLRAEKAR